MWRYYWNGSEYISKKIICHFKVVNETWFSASSGANFCLITFSPSYFLKFEIFYEFPKSMVFCQKKQWGSFPFWILAQCKHFKKRRKTQALPRLQLFIHSRNLWILNPNDCFLPVAYEVIFSLLSTIFNVVD